MIESQMVKEEPAEIIIDMDNGEYMQFDMTLPLQVLFDDIMTFVSKTDF